MTPVRCLADAALPVERVGFERLCRKVAAQSGAVIEVRFAGSASSFAAELRDADEAGIPVVAIPGALGELRAVQEAARAARDVVWLDLSVAAEPRLPYLDPLTIPSIRGRGLEGLLWAVRSAVARRARPPLAEPYGTDIEQVGELRLPDGAVDPVPVCVLLHGGGWRERWERDLMDGLAVDLTDHGYATWNLEFRRVGPSGGGWPAMFLDVAAGIDHLELVAEHHPLDLCRVALIGHSAGAQLALWAGARSGFAGDAPGAEPRVVPSLVVSLAGVMDLATTAERGTDEGSTIPLMGGMPDERADDYDLASPLALLPLGVSQLVVWGTDDRPDLVDENRRYCPAAQASGDNVSALELPGADHFTVIDPATLTWLAIRQRLAELFPPPSPTSQSEEGVPRVQAIVATPPAG